MTQIVKTVHRSVPDIVRYARDKALRSKKRFMQERRRRLLKKFPTLEERMAAYEAAVAFNKKHGIDPRAYKKRYLGPTAMGRQRNKPVTMPKLKFMEDES